MEASANDPRQAPNARKLRIAVVGAGSRGASLARTLHTSPDWELAAICDADPGRAGKLSEKMGSAPCFEAIDELLDSVEVDSVAIATPLLGLYGTVMTALSADKHVLVEKPLADSLERGREMAAAADANGLVLMVNNAQTFEPAVQKMQKLLASGSLGEILFVEAVRTEPAQAQIDRDVFWDLAPDSFTVLDHVLPGGLKPQEISAYGGDPLGTGRDCVGHVNFRLPNDAAVHLHINKLSRTKSHHLVIAGSRLTLVWDAMIHRDQLGVYDSQSSPQQQRRSSYWVDPEQLHLLAEDQNLPALGHEALGRVAAELARRIRGQGEAYSTGSSGLQVLTMLDAVTRSRSLDGQAAPVATPTVDATHRETTGALFGSASWAR
jgi:predicted dehydrogenase